MPAYCYRNGNDVITRVFPVSQRPASVRHAGRRYVRSLADERPGIPSAAGWPVECIASGVHPDQAQELRDFYRRSGVPTEVTPDGNPVYRNAAHRRKALKARGLHDKASYL